MLPIPLPPTDFTDNVAKYQLDESAYVSTLYEPKESRYYREGIDNNSFSFNDLSNGKERLYLFDFNKNPNDETSRQKVVTSVSAPQPITPFQKHRTGIKLQEFPTSPKLDDDALRILRTHFMEQILSDLQKIQLHSGMPSAAIYAGSLLRTMRTMRDSSVYDPVLDVVMALHDAMAFEDGWANYKADQYEKAYHIFKNLVKLSNPHQDKIENAICDLEGIGFVIIPFALEYDLGIDSDE